MTDPLDSMRRRMGSTEPDPTFRRVLMARVADELSVAAPPARRPRISDTTDITDTTSTTDAMEITVNDRRPRARPRGFQLGAAVVVAAAIIAAIVILANRTAEDTPGDASASTAVATSSASSTTSSSTTTTLAAGSDAQVAQLGLLAPKDVGPGWVRTVGKELRLDRLSGPGATSPACAPFLDTVFESPRRPAVVEVRSFSDGGSSMQQYVVVFRTDVAASAMMTSVKDSAFPACLAAIVTAAYRSMEPALERSALAPTAAPTITTVGDDMAVWAMTGTYVVDGTTYKDEGPIPFVRVGRAVMFMNPNTAVAPTNVPGYTLDQLHRALVVAVRQLRDAQRQ